MKKFIFVYLFISIIVSCASIRNNKSQSNNSISHIDTLRLMDSSRQREIPIAKYHQSFDSLNKGIIIFSHGYGHNYKDNYLIYSYLNRFLAENNYYVVSIQHELSNDSILPFTGTPQVVRLPFWERGVENILFVINSLKFSNPTLNFNNIILIGHSNGGDMSVLFPIRHPNIVKKVITLDHLRVTFPKDSTIEMYSLRSCDKEADSGVLLRESEQQKYNVIIEQLKNIDHNDMNDFGNRKSKNIIRNIVLDFVKQ